MASTEVDMWDWKYYWARLNPRKTREEMPKENPWKDDIEGFRRAVAIVEADEAPSGRIERSIWGVLVPSGEEFDYDWDTITPPNELGIDFMDTDPSQHPRQGSPFINPRLDAEHSRWGRRRFKSDNPRAELAKDKEKEAARLHRYMPSPSMAGIGGSLSVGPGDFAPATPTPVIPVPETGDSTKQMLPNRGSSFNPQRLAYSVAAKGATSFATPKTGWLNNLNQDAFWTAMAESAPYAEEIPSAPTAPRGSGRQMGSFKAGVFDVGTPELASAKTGIMDLPFWKRPRRGV